jgi:Peptidase M50B-like
MDSPYRLTNGAPPQSSRRPGAAPLIWATLVTLALWFVPYSNYLLYPLRLFVTFIHESGHAMAGLITGLGVASLHVRPDASGVTWVGESPIWDWLTLSGGYVGAALFGALLLQAARIGTPRSRGRVALYGASAYILLATVLWAHNPFNNPGSVTPDFFTPIVGVALAAILFAIARLATPRWAEFAASFLAVQCGLNALGDLRTLLYLTSGGFGDNDAVFMARHYLVPAPVWALLWAAIAIALLGASLWSYLRAPRVTAAADGLR